MPKGGRPAAVAVLLLPILPQGVLGLDLDRLTRVLVPALLAQQFAAACHTQDPDFLAEAGGLAAVSTFSEHVRTMISADLPPAQTREVLVIAATAARDLTLAEIRALPDPAEGDAEHGYARWCQRSAEPFIRTLMERHEQQRASIQRDVGRAKQPETDQQEPPAPN